MRLVTILVIAAGLATGWLLFTRFEREAPVIGTRTTAVHVGSEHLHELRVSDSGMGIERLRAWLESGSSQLDLVEESFEGSLLWGADLRGVQRFELAIRPAELGLADGPATLSIEAFDYSWSGNRTRVDVPLVIDTRPPRISLQTGLTYVRRGGAEMVVYEMSEEARLHGVEIGEHFSPGFPHPGDPNRFVAFYPFPPETPPGSSPAVVGEDRAGNRTKVGVSISVIERSFPEDRIELSQSFIEQKVSEILGGEEPDLLGAYLRINRDLRRENAEQIHEICRESSEDRLWQGAFTQLPNSSVGSRFGERRSYVYDGNEVDRQVHLGHDFASTARAEVPVANSGVVAFSGDLGIYGQSVIVDHGLGLFSLYGHLSEIAAEKGQVLAQGEVLGRTGSSGLAGGDHLHFAMMVGGTFVDPDEWIDPTWIQEHIEADLAVAAAVAGTN